MSDLTESAALPLAPARPWRRLSRHGLLSLLALAVCAILLRDKLAGIDWADVGAALAATPASLLALGLLLSALSHAALSGYDRLAFTRIGRRIPLGRNLRGGFTGTVIAQTLGFGIVTGSLARQRVYRANGISPAEALAVSAYVGAGFFSGLTVVLCGFTLWDPSLLDGFLPDGAPTARLGAALVLATILALCLAARGRSRSFRVGNRRLRLPDGRWLLAATLLAAADLVPAALCLQIFLPADALPSLPAFIGLYVAALALGHATGAPGGVGPFEGVLFLALPHVAPTDLAAAILLYRTIYYGPTFVLALWLAAAARRPRPAPAPGAASGRERLAWLLDASPRAEAELVCLGDKQVFLPQGANGFLMYAQSGRFWIVMGDPHGPRTDWDRLVTEFEASARAAGARIAVYKTEAAAVGFWQARGYALQPLGEDAVLDPQAFSLDGPQRRELRRKVAQARKSGLTLAHHAPGTAPMQDLADVAASWRAAKGGREQTFSMGHWDPAFAARHPVFTATLDGRIVAFLTVWVSGDGREWMIDLMRLRADAPMGTMHALISEAIAAAAAAGARTFNLCMAPLTGLDRLAPVTPLSRLARAALARHPKGRELEGLRRFKDMFRPDWAPRYLAARSTLDHAEALVAAARLVAGAARDTAPLHLSWIAPDGAPRPTPDRTLAARKAA